MCMGTGKGCVCVCVGGGGGGGVCREGFTKIFQIMALGSKWLHPSHLSFIDMYEEKLLKSSCVKLEDH